MDNAKNKQRNHYFFMAAVMMLSALIANLRFDMQHGYVWLIPCFFGFMGGVFIYAAIKRK